MFPLLNLYSWNDKVSYAAPRLLSKKSWGPLSTKSWGKKTKATTEVTVYEPPITLCSMQNQMSCRMCDLFLCWPNLSNHWYRLFIFNGTWCYRVDPRHIFLDSTYHYYSLPGSRVFIVKELYRNYVIQWVIKKNYEMSSHCWDLIGCIM